MSFLFFSVFLTGCQTEDLYLKNEEAGIKSDVRIKHLKGLEAKKAGNLLKSVLEKSGGLHLGSGSASMRTDEESIDYNNILLVLDTLGIKNYTFKILNHPNDDYKTFHNLVLTDKNGEFELTVMKYEMTDSFAEQYAAFLKSFNEFEGKISAMGLSTALDPCGEIVNDYPATIANPNEDDGGGSGETDPPPAGNPGDGSSVGGGNTWCLTLVIKFVCSCGRSYGSWDDYTGSICGDGSNPGFTVTMVISYSLDAGCRSAGEPCNPDGVIGVIDPEETPCAGDPVKDPKICPSSPSNPAGGTYGCTRNDPNRTCDGYVGKKKHGGVDIQGNLNDKVYSMYGGKIVNIRKTMGATQYQANSLGNYIEVESVVNGQTIRIKYCHLGNVNFEEEDIIPQGTNIGTIGRSGNAAAKGVTTHLHIQSTVKIGSTYQASNPIDLFTTTFNEVTFEPETDCN
ncbi:M23 family metallopeptidase [Flavobacterium terrisoli]|uniref:M23 family metallopeptidase n=1 Tax=Flavobacterium terrisoli TaxID=3242195 RepID=UPI002542A204|nr:M23 family metallopeptidase [Flavobacterium buctense]